MTPDVEIHQLTHPTRHPKRETMTTRPRIQRDNFPTCATCATVCKIGDQFLTPDGRTLCAACHQAESNPVAYLWISGGGEIVCRDHAGAYLQGAIDAAPHQAHHTTPLDSWGRVPAADAKAAGLDCESCTANRAAGIDVARIVGDYLDAARDPRNRGNDWEHFLADATAMPFTIADEVIEYAEEGGAILPGDDAIRNRVRVEVFAWLRRSARNADHLRVIDAYVTTPADTWQAVIDEMADHDPEDDAYWGDFLWALRFLKAGAGDHGMDVANTAREADRQADAATA